MELFWKLYEAEVPLGETDTEVILGEAEGVEAVQVPQGEAEGVEAVQVPLGEEQGEVQLGEEF